MDDKTRDLVRSLGESGLFILRAEAPAVSDERDALPAIGDTFTFSDAIRATFRIADPESVSWAQSHSLPQPNYPFPVTCEPCSIAAGKPVPCGMPTP